MTKEQIENILSLAKGGDVRKAVEARFKENGLSLDGMEASIGGIVAEVEQWRDADKDTREGIEAYKSAKDGSTVRQNAAKRTPAVKAKPASKTSKKSKKK